MPLLAIGAQLIFCYFPEKYLSATLVYLLLVVASVFLIFPISILWHHTLELPGIALGKMLIRKNSMRPNSAFQLEQKSNLKLLGTALNFKLRNYCLMCTAVLVFIFGVFWANAKSNLLSAGKSNNRAWSLATSPNPSDRNGELAVNLAENACERTHYQLTIMVGTLAASYAEAGRFNEAITTAQKACELALVNGETNLLLSNKALLKLYQNHQPYHESSPDSH